MATKKINITDIFEAKSCGLCGSNELSLFYGVNDNFIEYCGIYYPFREILSESLNFQISKEKGESMEICLDCKDKVLKFYLFKRKINEVQGQLKNNSSKKVAKPQTSQKRNKVVHSIYKIIENYTEKCSISKIRVDENNKKLIIESGESEQSRNSRINQDDEEMDDYYENDAVETTIVKTEPLLLCESSYINECNDDYFQNDEDYGNENFDSSGNISEPTKASTSNKPPAPKKPKIYVKTKAGKADKTPKNSAPEQDIGLLHLTVVDTVNAFNADKNKFSDKYADVFRRLMFKEYQTRIVVNFSYIGKIKVRVTVLCEKCRQSYKIEGMRNDLVEKIATVFTIRANVRDFCRCGYIKPNSVDESITPKRKDSVSNISDANFN